MKRKIVVSILLIAFASIGIFAGWKIYEQQSEYQSGESAYDSLEQHVRIPDPVPSGTDEANQPSVYGEPAKNAAGLCRFPTVSHAGGYLYG